MYKAHAVSTDHWRHFIPFAPDFDFIFVMGEKIVIPMKDILIQGARDFNDSSSPDPDVLPARVPVQRGWLLDLIVGELPRGTTLTMTNDKFNLVLTSNTLESKSYCINYQLSNGYQLSNYGRITFRLIVPYPIRFNLTSYDPGVYQPGATEGTFKFQIFESLTHPGYSRSYVFRYIWHVVEPQVVETIDGVDYIDEVDTVVYQTYFMITGGAFYMIDPARILDNFRVTTDSHLSGIDKRTGLAYVNQHKFPDIYVVHRNYNVFLQNGLPDLSKYQEFVHYITAYRGPNWHRSAQVNFT